MKLIELNKFKIDKWQKEIEEFKKHENSEQQLVDKLNNDQKQLEKLNKDLYIFK